MVQVDFIEDKIETTLSLSQMTTHASLVIFMT